MAEKVIRYMEEKLRQKVRYPSSTAQSSMPTITGC
jgi:hypothetical protein